MTDKRPFDVELHEPRPETRLFRVTVDDTIYWLDADESVEEAFGPDAQGELMAAIPAGDARQLADWLGVRLDLCEFGTPEAIARAERIIWALGFGLENVCEHHPWRKEDRENV